ncbi:MAG: 4a-hydroxytetrahydrobiopterin dehydratase [Gemmatimonadales bacterium]
MALLSNAEIEGQLVDLHGWAREGDAIVKRYALASFPEAIEFVRRVADRAEAANHHPDIAVYYKEVVLTLSTHSEGGITQKDLDAARSFDAAL